MKSWGSGVISTKIQEVQCSHVHQEELLVHYSKMEQPIFINEEQHHGSLLCDQTILKCMTENLIVIEPFNPLNLGPASYDVTLGEWYYREQDGLNNVYNMYSKGDVERVWGVPRQAKTVAQWKASRELLPIRSLENISDDDRIIWIKPGESILAHTNEFIGGRKHIACIMSARSSVGRNFLTVCNCANFGGVGFVNRYCCEITNRSRQYNIPLVVGRRIASILFLATDKDSATSYNGKYQSTDDIDELKKTWSPEQMLPKLYLDREIVTTTPRFKRQDQIIGMPSL